jgi:hypothetical protein
MEELLDSKCAELKACRERLKLTERLLNFIKTSSRDQTAIFLANHATNNNWTGVEEYLDKAER